MLALGNRNPPELLCPSFCLRALEAQRISVVLPDGHADATAGHGRGAIECLHGGNQVLDGAATADRLTFKFFTQARACSGKPS